MCVWDGKYVFLSAELGIFTTQRHNADPTRWSTRRFESDHVGLV